MVQDPIDLAERSTVAKTCVEKLNMPMPAVVDRLDDKVNQAYKGWPDRLYLIGKDGKLAYSGGRGPFFFAPAELETAIEAEVARIRSTRGDIDKSKVDKLEIRRR